MKLIYLVLVLLSACGKKNFQPPHRLFTDESQQRLIPQTGTLTTYGGGEMTLDWKLKSATRPKLLQLASERYNEAILPDRIEFYADLSAQKSFWELYLNEAKFEKFIVEGLKPVPVTPGDIQRGRIYLYSVGGDTQHAILMQENYRLIISTPEGDQVHYVNPSKPLSDFWQKQGLTDNDWRFINLPKGLRSPVSAGESYAAIAVEEHYQIQLQHESFTRATDIKNISPFNFDTSGSVTLFFSHAKQHSITKSQGQGSRNVMGYTYSCDYPVYTSNGYIPYRFSNAQDALNFLRIPQYQVLWVANGSQGVAIHLHMLNQETTTSIAIAPRATEKVRIGHWSTGACSAGSHSESSYTDFLWADLKLAMFWDDSRG